jgi:hypothetical protein
MRRVTLIAPAGWEIDSQDKICLELKLEPRLKFLKEMVEF